MTHGRTILHVIPDSAPAARVKRVGRLLEALAEPGTRVEVMSLPDGPPDLEYHVDSHRAVGLVLAALGKRAAPPDGLLIGCFYDPGVRELREALTIPVMGIGEASMLVASCLGHRFSILVGRRKWIPRMSDNALRYGFDRRIASWRPIEVTVQFMHQDPAATYEALVATGRAALREDGAEVLVLGCASLENSAERLQRELGCPVVDPVVAGFKVIEMLASLRERVGLTLSKLGDYESR